ncbi:MAG: hypothetical protein Q7J30_02700 [Candidatus Azambacteria bacterium]|nr:hypothetical protein [Candidatus Azambacteria bacterium]
MEFLKNLQNKPEPVKKTIMLFGIFFIMLAIFGFWLLTFPSQIQKTGDNAATAKLKTELPGIWQTLKSQVNSLQNLWRK